MTEHNTLYMYVWDAYAAINDDKNTSLLCGYPLVSEQPVAVLDPLS